MAFAAPCAEMPWLATQEAGELRRSVLHACYRDRDWCSLICEGHPVKMQPQLHVMRGTVSRANCLEENMSPLVLAEGPIPAHLLLPMWDSHSSLTIL